MGLLYKHVIRPVLFRQDTERAHEMGVLSLKLMTRLNLVLKLTAQLNQTNASPINLFGLTFPNRVGLAAGFDKNAECWPAAHALGFGHVEVGTVTYHRQPGNPKPRLFRFPDHEAVVNRMGFNNDGAEAIAERLSKAPKPSKRKIPLGINLGKSKAVPTDEAIQDYINSFKLLADYADYITINVSSPNTPGLRKLQNKEAIDALLGSIQSANQERANKLDKPPLPLLLKISPDLNFKAIDDILEAVDTHAISGVIATNTTLSHPDYIQADNHAGGLSGAPLFDQSHKVVKYVSLSTNGKLPIIASGGILSTEAAGKMIDVGASLVQVYTGLIYNGPFFGRDIARSLAWSHRDWV